MTAGQAATSSKSPPALVLYDGACGICQAFALWLMRLDRSQRLSLIPYQRADLHQLAPGVPQKAVEQALHTIDPSGHAHRGARAVFEALRRLPGIWGVVGTLLANPFLSALSEPFYRLIARYRSTVSKLMKIQVCEPAPSLLRGPHTKRED